MLTDGNGCSKHPVSNSLKLKYSSICLSLLLFGGVSSSSVLEAKNETTDLSYELGRKIERDGLVIGSGISNLRSMNIGTDSGFETFGLGINYQEIELSGDLEIMATGENIMPKKFLEVRTSVPASANGSAQKKVKEVQPKSNHKLQYNVYLSDKWGDFSEGLQANSGTNASKILDVNLNVMVDLSKEKDHKSELTIGEGMGLKTLSIGCEINKNYAASCPKHNKSQGGETRVNVDVESDNENAVDDVLELNLKYGKEKSQGKLYMGSNSFLRAKANVITASIANSSDSTGGTIALKTQKNPKGVEADAKIAKVNSVIGELLKAGNYKTNLSDMKNTELKTIVERLIEDLRSTTGGSLKALGDEVNLSGVDNLELAGIVGSLMGGVDDKSRGGLITLSDATDLSGIENLELESEKININGIVNPKNNLKIDLRDSGKVSLNGELRVGASSSSGRQAVLGLGDGLASTGESSITQRLRSQRVELEGANVVVGGSGAKELGMANLKSALGGGHLGSRNQGGGAT